MNKPTTKYLSVCILLVGTIYALFWMVNAKLDQSQRRDGQHSPIVRTQSVKAAGIDYTKYTQPPFNLPAPNGDSDTKYDDATIARANTLGGFVAKHQSYLQGKFSGHPDYVDAFAAVIYNVAIEGTAADPYEWNCNDSVSNVLDSNLAAINNGCSQYFNSGDWQVNGAQVAQSIGHLAADFKEAYGTTDATKMKEVAQRVMSAKNITNPATIPAWSVDDIVNKAGSPGSPNEVQSPSADQATARQLIAILMMDPEVGALVLSLEIAGDISGSGDWVGTMRNWGYTDFQTWSNRAKYLADHYTGAVSSSSSTGSVGGGSFSLNLVLKPKDNDSYVLNMATAQAIGGGSGTGSGSASTGQGAPPGSIDGSCTPTGTPPSDPGAELLSKYKITTQGFSTAGIINIYNLFTCFSSSRVPSLLGKKDLTIYSDVRPNGAGIGMGCDSTCGIWIPEGTNYFKFILTHELGHVLYYTNTVEVMHVSEFENAWTKEQGLSPYSRRNDGCEALGEANMAEDYAELVAYYLNPTGGRTGACDPGTGPLNPLYETNNYPLHLEVAKQVL